MNFLFSILIFLTINQGFVYNPFWVLEDKKMVKGLVKLNKNNPKEIENYILNWNKTKEPDKENLGFGWSVYQSAIAGGYISINVLLFYYNDSLVSYKLSPALPSEKGLKNIYIKWYRDFFDETNGSLQPYYLNAEALLKPLDTYSGNLQWTNMPDNLLNYTSVESGTMYGVYGGYPFAFLPNRYKFLKICSNLTIQQLILLMHSKNPASRFTAIEYYLRYQNRYPPTPEIDSWVKKNYEELPLIETMFGCSRENISSEALVLMYVGIDEIELYPLF